MIVRADRNRDAFSWWWDCPSDKDWLWRDCSRNGETVGSI